MKKPESQKKHNKNTKHMYINYILKAKNVKRNLIERVQYILENISRNMRIKVESANNRVDANDQVLIAKVAN